MSPEDAMNLREPAIRQAINFDEIAALLPFDGIDTLEAKNLLSRATLRRVKPNTPLFEEGQPADTFYLLLEGVARMTHTTPEGEQVILIHITPGQLFGIAKAYDTATYQTTTRAASEALLLSWPSDLWETFNRDYPGFMSASRQAIGVRMKDMREKVVAMATLKVEQRIAHTLLRLSRRAGKTTQDGIEIDFPITRQDISEMTGTTLYSVSRYLSQWQKRGIITSTRRRVVIRQPDALPV